MRKEFENDPVLFIAVNSGNPKKAVESYVSSVKAEWPVYVDADRSFEKVFGFEISLNNIFQACTVKTNGEIQMVNPGDLSSAVKSVVGGAKWKIAPGEVPEPLKKAWRALEFGQSSVAAPLIKQAQAASDPKVKEAAKKLAEVVVADITQTLEAAKAKADSGQKWEAYKLYSSVADGFKDFAESKPAQTEIARLKTDAKVSRENQAKTMLAKCLELLASQKKTEQQQGHLGVQTVAQQYADTEAGAQAKAMPAPPSK